MVSVCRTERAVDLRPGGGQGLKPPTLRASGMEVKRPSFGRGCGHHGSSPRRGGLRSAWVWAVLVRGHGWRETPGQGLPQGLSKRTSDRSPTLLVHRHFTHQDALQGFSILQAIRVDSRHSRLKLQGFSGEVEGLICPPPPKACEAPNFFFLSCQQSVESALSW
jgi:hypothetical protein